MNKLYDDVSLCVPSQELIVRWFQFGAFCPLFRLHGARAGLCMNFEMTVSKKNFLSGGPPSNKCGWTGGDNEVWTLAKDGEHYEAMVKVCF